MARDYTRETFVCHLMEVFTKTGLTELNSHDVKISFSETENAAEQKRFAGVKITVDTLEHGRGGLHVFLIRIQDLCQLSPVNRLPIVL